MSKAIIDVPINVAGCDAGLIDAPDINTKKNMSRPTIPPMSIPLYPLNPLAYTTTTITAINKADANTSIPNIVGSGKT